MKPNNQKKQKLTAVLLVDFYKSLSRKFSFALLCCLTFHANAQNEAMFIGSNGNVGIGKESLGEKLEVNGNVKANGLIVPNFPNNALVPAGVIVMWSGSTYSIPAGWALCDGTSGRPDLRSRFIVGYDNRSSDPGGNYWDYGYYYPGIGYTEGALNETLTISNMPSHTHTGTTDNSGHHVHTWNGYRQKCVCAGQSGVKSQEKIKSDPKDNATNDDGDHQHALEIDPTGGGMPFDNRPPFYTLAYIIKLP